MSAPRIAPDVTDPEAGRGQVYDPSRSRASSSGTAVSVEGPPPKTVMQTGLFKDRFTGLTRPLEGEGRRHRTKKYRKKSRKTKKNRKSRR